MRAIRVCAVLVLPVLTTLAHAADTGLQGRTDRLLPGSDELCNLQPGKTATLTPSDWKSPAQAGGPEGEELIWNFVQVQPYFAAAAE